MNSDHPSKAADPGAKSTDPGLLRDPAALLGEVIDGRYRVLEFVGQGGMGSVYRAEHVTIRRPVALKVLHHSLAGIPELRSRFEREAFAIGRIDHPNCVNVSDFGSLEDGSLFLVMEFLEGESLGDLLDREQRVAPARALHIIRHVLRGLKHAHGRGIVHRDVKPENVVLIENDGDEDFAKVLDFGIAKLVGRAETDGGGEKLTQAGIAFGTPTYLSPEQAVGQPADPRADLYSATVMLFEMVAGRPPFYSEDKLELLAMHATRPPPPVSEIAPDLDVAPELEALLRRGLAKQPDDRYASALEYIAAIDAVLEAPKRVPAPDPPREGGPPPGAPTPPAGTPSHPNATPPPGMLTPVPGQLAATASRSSARRQLAAVLVLAVAVLASGYLLVVRGESDPTQIPSFGAPPPVEEPDEEVQKAVESFEKGDLEASEQALAQRPDLAENPAALLQLGHTRAARSQEPEALETYLRAVELDPLLGVDPKLQANLGLMIDDDGPVYPDAVRILYRFAPDDESRQEVKERLLELAVRRNNEVRQKAFAAAVDLGFGDEIDRLASFRQELENGRTCPDRREAVAKLRALGDRRAVPALQQARRQRRKNKCLLRHAGDAIRYLSSLPAEPAETPGD
jgi:eukaryotic-like serine/threonine-protein kinase